MARVDTYRKIIQEVLTKYSGDPSFFGVENQLIFDTEHDHYQLAKVGWNGQKRYFGSVIHMDIKNDKVWIQHDGTEHGVANDLLERGIPKEDIVLGFHHPFQRKLGDFAVGE